MTEHARRELTAVVLRWASVLLILKVLASILSNYSDYFPPNFEADFLLARDWTYPVAAWTAWLVPIFGLELVESMKRWGFENNRRFEKPSTAQQQVD